jgi:hypothetical protein
MTSTTTANLFPYEYNEIILDSALAFQTSQAGSSSSNTPEFFLGNGLSNVVGMKLVEFTCPVSWYNWTEDIDLASGRPMNQIVFQSSISSNIEYITVPVGSYTGPELAAELTTLINTSLFVNTMTNMGWPGGFWTPNTVTYVTSTSKFVWEINVTDNFAFAFNINIIMYGAENVPQNVVGFKLASMMLGIKSGGGQSFLPIQGPDDGSNTTFTLTSSFVASPQGPNYLYLNSDKLGSVIKLSPNQDITNGANNYQFNNVGYQTPQIAMIPIPVNNFGVIFWQEPASDHADTFNLQNMFQLQRFDLYLTLGPYTKKIIDLNGLSFICKFKVYTLPNGYAPL